jgi:hypothetical protein
LSEKKISLNFRGECPHFLGFQTQNKFRHAALALRAANCAATIAYRESVIMRLDAVLEHAAELTIAAEKLKEIVNG